MDTEKLKEEAENIQEKVAVLGKQTFEFNFPKNFQSSLISTASIVTGIIIGLIVYISWWGIN